MHTFSYCAFSSPCQAVQILPSICWHKDMTQMQKAFGIHLSQKAEKTETASRQTLNGLSCKSGCLMASSFCGYFISLWYWLEAGCTVITLTHICETQGPLLPICCLPSAIIPFSGISFSLFSGKTHAFYMTFYHYVLTTAFIKKHFLRTSHAA